MQKKKEKGSEAKGKSRLRFFLLVLGCLTAMPLILFLQDIADVTREADPTTVVQEMEKDLYNGYGLEGDQHLAGVVLSEKEGILRYSDRWLVRFTGNVSDSGREARLVSALKNADSSIENVYVLPIPPRIVTESGYEEEQQAYAEYMEELTVRMNNSAQVVDVLPILEEHSEEYLFFRTEDSWTARGAFYGTTMLCQAMGIEPLPLEEYEEHMYNRFRGNLYQPDVLTAEEKETFLGEPVYYYILPDAKNRQTSYRVEEGEVKSPVIKPSSSGLASFVGGSSFEYAVIEGEARSEEKADEVLLLICDNAGKLMAPLLSSYYKQVYVVNLGQYDDLSVKLSYILDEYPISDVVWAQSARYMGNRAYTRALNGFLE